MTLRVRTGVTVVEVIAVLAIIVVVAAVILPVFQRHVSTNPRSYCVSNLKQLSLALIQYEQDADETFPAGINAVGNGWAGELFPFIKTTRVYHCPNDAQDGNFISYAENRNLVKQRLTRLAAPARTVAFYEFTTLNCDPSAAETVSATGVSAPQDSARHNTDFGLNFVAADGHVQYLKPGQVSDGPNAVRPKTLPQGGFVETFAAR